MSTSKPSILSYRMKSKAWRGAMLFILDIDYIDLQAVW